MLAWRGELDEAERLIEESVRAARQLGNVRSVGNWLRALGVDRAGRRDYARARLLFEESLALHRTLGDAWGISHSLSNLALVLLEARDDDTARSLLAESVAIELSRAIGWGSSSTSKFAQYWRLQRAAATGPSVSTHVRSVLRESVGIDPSRLAGPTRAARR